MKDFIIILLLMGLSKRELLIAILLIRVYLDSRKEIKIKEIKTITSLDRTTIVETLMRLEDIKILYTRSIGDVSKKSLEKQGIFIIVKEKVYIFNPDWKDWIPTVSSPGYKISQKLNLPERNYLEDLVKSYNKNPLQLLTTPKADQKERINGRYLLQLFCEKYQEFYGKRYNVSGAKDGSLMKRLLEQFVRNKYRRKETKEFLEWVFREKAGKFKWPITPPALRSLSNEYMSVQEPEKEGTYLDFDGRLRVKEGGKSEETEK